MELLILLTITMLLMCSSSCSFKQFYPTGGAIVGGGVGSLGGPATAAVGAGAGALVGEIAKGNEEIEEARETIEALTTGDVEALVQKGMGEHKNAFEDFVSTIQRILLGAGVCLLLYLGIPLIVAQRCARTEAAKSLTRAPFPTSPPRPTDRP